MSFFSMRAILIVLVSVMLTVKIYGELIMIRYPPKMENGMRVQQLTCISENDGNAFVWNGDLNDTSDDTDSKKYLPGLWDYSGEWKQANVVNEPMSPVVDFRWEDFKDEKAKRDKYLINLKESGTIVFSVRGSHNINLRFGEDNTVGNNSCFRIILAASDSAESAIRACDGRGSEVGKISKNRGLISRFEWRTFIIKWNGSDKIEVKEPGKNPWDPTKKIMEMGVDRWVNISQLFVENDTGQRFRFHTYTYGLTYVTGAYAMSEISPTTQNLYAELPVSLCSKCQLNFKATDNNNISLVTKTIHSKKPLAENELPFWQLERLHIPLNGTNYKNPIMFKISTNVTQTGYKGRWAYKRPKFHESEDDIRYSTRNFARLSDASHFSCQKLFDIDGPSVVHSNGGITNISSTNLDKCIGGTGKFCDFKCGGSCKGTSICNRDGCTCAPGFTGNNCNAECPPRKFGFNCQKNCDLICGNHTCDRITGCQTACLNHFLPPKCTKELTKPDVQCIPETGVRLKYSMTLDGNERKYLQFQIKSQGQGWNNVTLNLERGSTWYVSKEIIEELDLEPKTEYKVRAVLNETYGPETGFNTRCWELSKPQNISLICRDNGTMTLKWRHNPSSWEKKITRITFEIRYALLNASPPGHIEIRTKNSTGKQQLYQMKIQLESTKNYTFSIQPKDENYTISKAINVWYLIPNEDTFDRSDEKLPNSTMKRLSSKLPGFVNDSEEIHVIMQRSSSCPILKPNQNSTENSNFSITKANFSRPKSLEEGEYPACILHFNKTYLFIIAAPTKDEQWLGSLLIWLLISSSPVFCCLLSYVLYRNKKRFSITLSSINYASNIKLLPINEQEESLFDNCVPPEMQKLKSFEIYVRKSTENGVLQQQFMSLPRGLVRPCDYGRLPDNKPKNRYGNLIAYDDTRVLLSRDSRGIHSDYINANYVQGYCKEKAYIATQGPLAETVVDFWRMIWQEEVRVICMLVDLVESGKNMCEQYWPEIGEEIQYGDIVILTMKQRSFADYTYRTFLVTKSRGTESQTVEHLQYTGWPEEGIPMYSHSVVEFLQKLLSVPPGQGPVVVHCSSGTGRTGAMILADICWRHLAVEGTVDVLAEAKKMYNARANMIRNFSQYVLSHLVPTQCLIMLPTRMLCSNITQEKIEEMKNDLPTHVARLADCAWMDKALRSLEPLRPPDPENMQKNRFPKLTPVGPNLVTLSRYPTYDDNSYYISAVSVDGVKIKKQYIASQLPMPSTLTDFWRLIVEQHIELVIILQHPDSEDITCCDIIPRGTTLIPVPYLKVETKVSSKRNQHFTTDKLLLTDTSQKLPRTRTITALTCNNWSPEEVARPPPPETLVELWRASENIKRGGPTLVLCYDGITASGLYLTLSFMLERMGLEQECDLILAVRAVRQSRPEFMCFQWQFEYLYDAAVKYVECFRTYGNFNRGLDANHWCE